MQAVKEYYTEVENYAISKADKQKEIEEKLKETYDAYCGSKAADLEKKIKAAIYEIE